MVETSHALGSEVRDIINDKGRLAVLAALRAMDLPEDPDFSRLARLAASVTGRPLGLIVMVDADRHAHVARHGADLASLPERLDFCDAAIASGEALLVIPDASADPRFADALPQVAGVAMRFFVGVPIVVRDQRLGVLCALSETPRAQLDSAEIEQLAALAETAGSLLALKDEARVRAQTAAELIREEWRHALTLEAGKVGSWSWDITSGEVTGNDILRCMFGTEPDKPISIDDIFASIAPEHVDRVKAALRATFDEGADYSLELRLRNGRWLMARGRVYERDAGGKPLVMMGIHLDTTEAREGADRTRQLLRELNHRVKNTLAMIQSLARQTLRQSANSEGFVDAFSGRLRTLSDAHALLSDRDWSGVGLVEIISAQLSPFLAEGPGQLALDGRDVHLSPDHALGIGLILHELASNARKFGALSHRDGRVTISWTEDRETDGAIELIWKESGGPPVNEPARRGFGTRLIERSLDKVLGSRVELSFPVDGVEARITFPLSVPLVAQASSFGPLPERVST